MLLRGLKHATPASLLLLLLFQQNILVSAILSCAKDVLPFPVDIEKLSGMGYEVARIPEVEVPACVNVLAPSSLTGAQNDSYALRINFVNNVNKQWLNTTETLTFPWSTEASHGSFDLVYGSNTVTFTYKIALTDYTSMAVVCGYTSFSTSVSFLKVLSRERHLSKPMEEKIKTLAEKYAKGITVGWVEQSSKCNGATRWKPVLVTVFGILWVLFRCNFLY